jgi:B12-binding domain/radical SAM domain protein
MGLMSCSDITANPGHRGRYRGRSSEKPTPTPTPSASVSDFFDASPLIFYYHRLNTYSFNALAGAIDRDADISDLPIALPSTEEQLKKATSDIMERCERAILALSILTCQFEEIQQIVRWVRNNFGDRVAILAGGPHATACAREVLESGIDIVFPGEAEAAFPAVLNRIGRGQDFRDIPGIAFLKDGEVVVRPQAQAVNLDTFFSFSPKRGMFGPIEMTRGCAFACRYCQTSYIFGASLRHRSVESIVRQAAALRSGNRKIVRLLSPNAFSYGSSDGRQLNLDGMRRLLAALREAVGKSGRIIFAHFPSEARPEHVTPDTLSLMKEFANNDEIVIGAQSGSPRILEACNRSHTVEDVLAAVSLARKCGYKLIVDFIFGLPGESTADLRESLKVMEEIVRLGARIHAHLFAPLPQTPFSKEQPGRIDPAVMYALEKLKARQGIYENRRNTIRA